MNVVLKTGDGAEKQIPGRGSQWVFPPGLLTPRSTLPLKSSSFEVWFFQLGVTSRDLWALKINQRMLALGLG